MSKIDPKEVIFFGCWSPSQKGHHFYRGRFHVNPYPISTHIDGGFLKDANIRDVPGKGIFFQTEGYSVVSFWDRSGDSRSASNTAFMVKGERTLDDLLEAARSAYPDKFAALPKLDISTWEGQAFDEGGPH